MFSSPGSKPGRGAATPRDTVVVFDHLVTGAAVSTITIRDIPQQYRNLRLSLSGRANGANGNQRVVARFNGDSGNNYDWLFRQNNAVDQGAYATSGIVFGWVAGGGAPANYPGSAEMHIFGYSDPALYKTGNTTGTLMNGASQGFLLAGFGFWKSVNPIIQIELSLDANSFAVGCGVQLIAQG